MFLVFNICLLFLVHSSQAQATKWILTWSDEFDEQSLDLSKWNVKTNVSHDEGHLHSELQLYLPEQIKLNHGHLQITAEREHVLDPNGKLWNFSSGWIDTQNLFHQQYGRFETNMSLPPESATGIWPAFWLLPQNLSQCWPTGGEIDVFEFNGNPVADDVFASYHWGRACGVDQAPIPGKSYMESDKDWQTAWHVYAVEWFKDRLDYYVDDVLYYTKTSQEVILPSSSMYVIINLAIDGLIFPPSETKGIYPAIMNVDYIRVYQDQAYL